MIGVRYLLDSLGGRLSLVIVPIGLAGTLLMDQLLTQRLGAALIETEIRQLQVGATSQGRQFIDEMKDLREDVRFLTAASSVRFYVRDMARGVTPNPWRDDVVSTFSALLASKPDYLSARLIAVDAQGRELVRVDNEQGRVSAVNEQDLQAKGDSSYMRAARRAPSEHDLLVSDIELNREHGEVEEPEIAVVRVMGRVRDAGGTVRLLLVVNYHLDTLFESLERTLPPPDQLYIVDRHDHFIRHPDRNRQFAHEKGLSFGIVEQWGQEAADWLSSVGPVHNVVSRSADSERMVVARYPASYDPNDLERRVIFATATPYSAVVLPTKAVSRHVYIVAMGVAVTTLVVTVLVVLRVTRPLHRLVGAAAALGAGDYRSRIDEHGPLEVRELAGAFNLMSSRVEETLRAQEKLNRDLAQSRDFLDRVLDNIPAIVFIKDTHSGEYLRVNRAAEILYGAPAEDIVGKKAADFFESGAVRNFADSDAKALETDGPVLFPEELVHSKASGQRILRTMKQVVRDQDGRPQYIIGIADDITEAVNLDRQLRRGEQRYKVVLETVPDAVIVVNDAGRITTFNAAATALFGYEAEEIAGQDVAALITESERPARGWNIDAYLATGGRKDSGETRMMTGRRKDGTTFPFEFTVGVADFGDHRLFIGVGRDVSVRLANERTLIVAREAAEQANAAKSRFLANTSHELRTPLNAIIGYSEMLAEDAEDGGTTQARQDLEKILGAGRHLLALINDVLDLSKIEAGRMLVERQRFDFSALVEELHGTFEPLAAANGNRLDCEVPATLGKMVGDQTKVRQILINLLGNAIKFTENGTIALRVQAAEGADGNLLLTMTVTDTGNGMGERDLATIFDPFVQADAGRGSKAKGSGLGLPLSREYCRLLGGDLTVASTPGRGSTFTAKVLVERSRGIETAVVSGSTTGTLRPDVDRLGASLGGQGLVLLIVEDMPARELLARELQQQGWRVVAAIDGWSGLQLARQLAPDAMVLDAAMHDVDGWSALEAMKTAPDLAALPVVMCSIEEGATRGCVLGAADYLIKPVSREAFEATVEKYVRDAPFELLVVDADAGNRSLLQRMARSCGWRARGAADGDLALERLAAQQVDLVVLDLLTAHGNDADLLQAIQAHPCGRRIPVVALVSKDLSDVEKSRLDDYLGRMRRMQGLSAQQFAAEILRRLENARDRA